MRTQALYNPCNILAFAELGSKYELTAQSGGAFVAPHERISYWQLMVCRSLHIHEELRCTCEVLLMGNGKTADGASIKRFDCGWQTSFAGSRCMHVTADNSGTLCYAAV